MKKFYLLFLFLFTITTASFGQYVNMVFSNPDLTGNSFGGKLVEFNGKLIYKANAKSYSYWYRDTDTEKTTKYENEVWISDATEIGSNYVDVNTDITAKIDAKNEAYIEYGSSNMDKLIKFNGNLYFMAKGGAADGLGTYKVDASNNVSRVADWYMTNPAVNGTKLNFIEYEYGGDQPILEWDGINDPETLPNQTDNYQTTGDFCKLGDKFIV
ncbi:MAG: hypothetical protein ABFS35_20125, partial [Bacteroidota bacterium]